MLKLSNLIQTTGAITDAAAPSQFAMHALNRDSEGLLTYSKVFWANTSETVDLTDGSGITYNGLEELITGFSIGNTNFNLTRGRESESGVAELLDNTFVVRVVVSGSNTSFTINGNTEINPALELYRGSTYKFITEDPSTQNHPLFISSAPSSGSYTNEFLKGVQYSRSANDGNGFITVNANVATSETLVFKVPMDAPNQLYYSSGQDNNCFGTLTITAELTNPKHRKYEQVRFDNLQLSYFLNSNGFLVARYGADYSY